MLDNQNLPSFSDLTYSEVPVSDLEVGSFILVKAGEVCIFTSFRLSCIKNSSIHLSLSFGINVIFCIRGVIGMEENIF